MHYILSTNQQHEKQCCLQSWYNWFHPIHMMMLMFAKCLSPMHLSPYLQKPNSFCPNSTQVFNILDHVHPIYHGVKCDIFAKYHMIVVTISRMEIKIKTFFTFVGNATSKCSNKCTSSWCASYFLTHIDVLFF